ncbi:MAG TPA: hypothetical protein VKI44_01955 [Acetobacteraceae bacterium]|nr:hypothetical protein [Acetobacteraceae bacterium]
MTHLRSHERLEAESASLVLVPQVTSLDWLEGALPPIRRALDANGRLAVCIDPLPTVQNRAVHTVAEATCGRVPVIAGCRSDRMADCGLGVLDGQRCGAAQYADHGQRFRVIGPQPNPAIAPRGGDEVAVHAWQGDAKPPSAHRFFGLHQGTHDAQPCPAAIPAIHVIAQTPQRGGAGPVRFALDAGFQ